MLRERRVICKNAFDRLKKQLDFFNAGERVFAEHRQESDHKSTKLKK